MNGGMGIGLISMPTAAVCKAYSQLKQDIVTLHELQQVVSQKEYQVQLLKDQKQVLFNNLNNSIHLMLFH